MNKRVVTWVLILAVLGAAVAGIVWKVRKPSEPDIRFETAQVERGRLTASVTASGTLSALVTVEVGSQVSGRIEKLFVDFNSTVKKDEVVAKIEPMLFQADVRKANANLVAASGNLARAKAEADLAERQRVRTVGLRAEGLVSQADLDTAEANAVAAKANVEALKGAVEQSRAALYQAQVNLAYTTIKSPIDGVVISRDVNVGQTVAASLSAPKLFTIAEDLRKMQVDTFVAEADVGKLGAGMAVRFTVDAFPGRRFQGAVREIRNAAQTVQNVVTYDAVIDVQNPELLLKPGMTANVSVVVSEKNDALKVPNAALRFRPPAELTAAGSASGAGSAGPAGSGGPPGSAAGAGRPGGGGRRGPPGAGAGAPGRGEGEPGGGEGDGAPQQTRRTVWVLRDGRPQPVRVVIGVTDGTNTEVVEGDLKEGDAVIISSSGGAAETSTSTPARGGSPGGPGGMRRMF
ncbi:efflux RND transporter periplasmic adaptor subunit [Chondromyces apiculatus]|uniref:Macrolide-specific efflux protein MacA n=1 Tax=Chondromyces apiculatus DSM 436 TaxID=1192034 RepID=A0A017T7Z9_9BACT|nr:efflux RND transporter periplasmic adaptor subunit [Chondromyces apiculatus]EYF04721.1 Macrolide-specific efflux protein MacA [Chondromyces apiculatus DSM 436]